jgi:hypothetical protein
MIDYYLTEEPAKEVVLEILDANGALIRSFSSRGKSINPEDLELSDLKEKMKRIGGSILKKKPGMHRFFWDLKHPGAWRQAANWMSRGGPLVVPGTYQAKLTVGDWTHTESFRIKIDPRVKEDGITQEDLVAQEALSLQIRDQLTLAEVAAERIRGARKSQEFSQEKKEKLEAIYSKLVTAEGRYTQPMLIDQLRYLLSMLSRADQKPGRDAYIRFDELVESLSGCLSGADEILGER